MFEHTMGSETINRKIESTMTKKKKNKKTKNDTQNIMQKTKDCER